MLNRKKSCIAVFAILGATVGLVGCAASRADQPKAQELGVPNNKGFASQEECAQVADHLFTIQLHGTSVNVPQEHLLDGSNEEHRGQFNAIVTKCTTRFTHSDAACVLQAPAFQYVRQCELTQGTPSLVPTRVGQAHRVPGDF
jgi:hypothetical protein